jgi:hypothetical protein
VERLKALEEPSADEIAQIMLEEMIVSDPAWIQECAPARQKMWELAQASSESFRQLRKAVLQSGLEPNEFWQALEAEQGR